MIFVSHAVADRTLSEAFVDLLRMGIGVSPSEIFFSLEKGRIPNGEFFVEHILTRLNESDLVIALISRSYLESNFCLAEAGAALARKTAKSAKFYSFVVPPVSYGDLDGVLYGRQVGQICERAALSELYAVVAPTILHCSPLPLWDQKREAFLKVCSTEVGKEEATEFSKRIVLQNLSVVRVTDPNVTYKEKVRLTFENNTGKALKIDRGIWNGPSMDSLIVGPYPYLKWQVKSGGKVSDPDTVSIEVPPEHLFRTWIAIGTSTTDQEIAHRLAMRTLGSIEIMVEIGGHPALSEHKL